MQGLSAHTFSPSLETRVWQQPTVQVKCERWPLWTLDNHNERLKSKKHFKPVWRQWMKQKPCLVRFCQVVEQLFHGVTVCAGVLRLQAGSSLFPLGDGKHQGFCRDSLHFFQQQNIKNWAALIFRTTAHPCFKSHLHKDYSKLKWFN